MTATIENNAKPDAGWLRCDDCGSLLYRRRFARNLSVCPECGWHSRLTAPERLSSLLDPGSVEPLTIQPLHRDHLTFTDVIPYPQRLAAARSRTGLEEAVVCSRGRIAGSPVLVAVMDFRFLGGTLGGAVGELITQTAELALSERTPLVLISASGGARVQEGALALMQMAKTSQALAQLDEAGILTISVVTDPTYGGVAASFAALCDVTLIEPGARSGFAGPEVISQTLGQTLPEGFQTAEFLLSRGLVDAVVPRSELRSTLGRLLSVNKIRRYTVAKDEPDPRAHRSPVAITEGDAWEAVQRARHVDRPTTLDYIAHMVEGFQELHGDRVGGECPAIIGGVGLIGGRPVVLIGHQKGHSTRELIHRNFGMAMPAGYRKAARLMRLAAKLGIPVVTLIDTPGAYPGVAAEEGGEAVAIAQSLSLMSSLPVPIVAVVTGEGGSGGALALGVADRVLALASAIYSVISPEGCAAILWKDTAAAARAAAALQIDVAALLRHGIVDFALPEPPGGAQANPAAAAAVLRSGILHTLAELEADDPAERIDARRRRFRRYASIELPSTSGGPP